MQLRFRLESLLNSTIGYLLLQLQKTRLSLNTQPMFSSLLLSGSSHCLLPEVTSTPFGHYTLKSPILHLQTHLHVRPPPLFSSFHSKRRRNSVCASDSNAHFFPWSWDYCASVSLGLWTTWPSWHPVLIPFPYWDPMFPDITGYACPIL